MYTKKERATELPVALNTSQLTTQHIALPLPYILCYAVTVLINEINDLVGHALALSEINLDICFRPILGNVPRIRVMCLTLILSDSDYLCCQRFTISDIDAHVCQRKAPFNEDYY